MLHGGPKPSWAGIVAAILAFAGCTNQPPPPPPLVAHPHYMLGAPYLADGHWYYPAENYALDDTGIATVGVPAVGLTADGEVADPSALTAAMPLIQLPAIVDVTNLENGRQIKVRVNDRGPADPARIIALSPRSAQLLLINGPTRVRVQVDTRLSRALTEQIGGGPRLAIATAAPTAVTAEPLGPPGSDAGPAVTLGPVSGVSASAAVPERLPEVIRMVGAYPGALYLRAGSFGRFNYANVLAARLSGLGGTVLRSREGKQEVYAVRAGPFATIPQADAALRQALGQGIVDARITVE
jgi:rare lipoprotein A